MPGGRANLARVLLRHRLVLLLAALVVAGGCTDSGGGGDETTTTASGKPPLVYAAVGASETVGSGADQPATQAWPRVLASMLGEGNRRVTFTSHGFGGATVADALARQVPAVEALQPAPDLVTVWLNANDIIGEFAIRVANGTSYEQRLDELVRRLRRGGATTVLVANTPALDRLPAYLGCLDPAGTRCLLPPQLRRFVPRDPQAVVAKVDAFNQAIARVAAKHGAVLVDLHGASLEAREAGREASLVSADGFHPSTAGHRAVAEVFAEAARKAGV